MLTGLLGGALALSLLVPPGPQLIAAGRAVLAPAEATAEMGAPKRVPYGVAIALAAVTTVTLSLLG